MPVEIERKYLVTGEEWRLHSKPYRIVQGYLSRDPDRVVRVRQVGDSAYMTVKGRTTGFTRSEIEFPIDLGYALDLLPMCIPGVIDKTRHEVVWEGFTWEIDEFHGANAGLILAEIELPSEDIFFELPPWIGLEVSSDDRFANSHLSEHPFSSWPTVWSETNEPETSGAFVSQNLRFTATVPGDEEFDHPDGAWLVRLVSRTLREGGWKTDPMKNWRGCGWSMACYHGGAEFEIIISPLRGQSWILQIGPLRVPGFLGRLSGAKASAEAGEVLGLARIIHRTLADSGHLANPQWCRDDYPDEEHSTSEPQ